MTFQLPDPSHGELDFNLRLLKNNLTQIRDPKVSDRQRKLFIRQCQDQLLVMHGMFDAMLPDERGE